MLKCNGVLQIRFQSKFLGVISHMKYEIDSNLSILNDSNLSSLDDSNLSNFL